jgi:Zn-dependent protease
MRDPWIWSVSLGRWWNVHVRLHMFFLLFAVGALYLTYLTSLPDVKTSLGEHYVQPAWWGICCVVTLLVSILLHETGHIVVARRLGGNGDEMVIGPLGGLNAVRVPFEPQSELVALMAGTLVNAFICLIAALLLAITRTPADLVQLLNPMSTEHLTADAAPLVIICKTVFWINWLLILVNFLPCFPFDGGRSLRSALMFLWPELDSRQSVITVARLGRVIAALLIVVALFLLGVETYDAAIVPPWFALTVLSIFVFFCAKCEEYQLSEEEAEDDKVFGYDFSQGYTSLERSVKREDTGEHPDPKPGNAFARWMERRRVERERAQLEKDADDERRVDEVLSKLHEGGMQSLSHEERQLLQRVSKRYRSRQS